jgi:hypothetical protein
MSGSTKRYVIVNRKGSTNAKLKKRNETPNPYSKKMKMKEVQKPHTKPAIAF